MGSHRSLRIILFTDLVGSSERATELGDKTWHELLQRHHVTVRQTLRHWGAREVSEAGDGFLAILDSPARGIACAAAIRETVQSLGLEVRCGVHMGEVEQAPDGSVGGIGVHIGARVAGLAEPGEILVSRAVRDAVEGSRFAFEDRGAFELKGIQGERRLFHVTALPEHAAGLAPGRSERVVSALRARPEWIVATAMIVVSLAAVLTLRGWMSEDAAPPPAREASIAVLPFVNLSPDPEDEYFSDGMTEEVIAALSQVKALRVAARTSGFAFKDRKASAQQIGEELGVATILEGSVRKAGNRLRITAQLVGTKDGYHLWTETYDRELADVFQVQEQIARAIVDALQIELSAGTNTRLGERATTDLDAYQLYLKGRHAWNQRTPEALRRAVEYFEEAIRRDARFARAHAGLADSWLLLPYYAEYPPAEAYPRAKTAARRALELDPGLAEAHASLAMVLWSHDWDWNGADREFRRALQLDPDYATGHQWYGEHLMARGRSKEGIAHLRRAVKLDPLSLIARTQLAWGLYKTGRPAESIQECRQVLKLDPAFSQAYVEMGWALIYMGEYEESVEAYRKAEELSGRDLEPSIAYAEVLAGRRDYASALLERALERSRREHVRPLPMARVLVALGRKDEAFDWLDRAYRERSDELAYLKVDQEWEPVRSDPRFNELLKRINLR